MKPLLDRLLDKISIEPNSGCWLWIGADDGGDGYGRMVVDNRSRAAHRVSYELHKGPVAEGLVIDHLCRVRCCVNPAHLEPVTSAENSRRGELGSPQRTLCKGGHLFEEHGFRTKSGLKLCRLCHRARNRAWYRKHGLSRSPIITETKEAV